MIESDSLRDIEIAFRKNFTTLTWILTVLQMILAMAKIANPEYNIQSWQQWLLYAATLWLAVAINVVGGQYIPLFSKFTRKYYSRTYICKDHAVEYFAVYFSLTSLVVTISTILACAAPNFQKASWVFADTTNSTGWNNKGLLLILCLLNNAYGFMGTDAGAHLAEEIPNPMVNVPKVIVS